MSVKSVQDEMKIFISNLYQAPLGHNRSHYKFIILNCYPVQLGNSTAKRIFGK